MTEQKRDLVGPGSDEQADLIGNVVRLGVDKVVVERGSSKSHNQEQEDGRQHVAGVKQR